MAQYGTKGGIRAVESPGRADPHRHHKESLAFEAVHPAERSYK